MLGSDNDKGVIQELLLIQLGNNLSNGTVDKVNCPKEIGSKVQAARNIARGLLTNGDCIVA